MSEWIDCPKCGENHENLCVCPEPSVRQPEEEKVVSDTPRTDAIIGQREFGSLPDSEYCALARTLERELAEANAKLSKLSRMIDIAVQANDAASEAEVANSATFTEALAHTNTEMVEAERDQLKAELVARTIERDALHGTVMKLILDAEKWHAVARELSMALGNDGVETNNDLSELARNNALASFNAMEKGQT